MRKVIGFILFSILFISLFSTMSFAQETTNDEINVYFFWAEGCPHCASEKVFLDKLEAKYDNVIVHRLEVTRNKENSDLLIKTGEELNVDVRGVPFTVVGEQHFIGWYNEETTGASIENAIQCVMQNHCEDVVSGLVTPITQAEQPMGETTVPEKLDIPIIGSVETKNISLPMLTLLIAGLDGFNPCAMWVLLFLISLLFGMENKRKMWLFGAVFIAASAFAYFLFMAAWLNIFLFLGFVLWIRLAIGGVAFWAAYYNLKEYFTNPNGGCKVTGSEKRQKIFEKLKQIIQERHVILGLLGLIVLAFAVNLVELICSAGLPAVYTQILALNNLPMWMYYSYLLLYVFIFMLDDLIVFFIAMKTLELTGFSTKYGRWSHLIGGIVMLIIGILMIFRPEVLMFG